MMEDPDEDYPLGNVLNPRPTNVSIQPVTFSAFEKSILALTVLGLIGVLLSNF